MSEEDAHRTPEEVSMDVLREMYDEAEPSADFDDIWENPEEYPDEWFNHHYLSDERQREILNKYLDRADLDDGGETQVTFTTILHYGPTGVKENVE